MPHVAKVLLLFFRLAIKLIEQPSSLTLRLWKDMPVRIHLDVLRGELRELMMPQSGLQIQPHDLRVTGGSFRAPVGRNDSVQPAVKILCDGLLLRRDIQACGLVAVECLELVGDSTSGLHRQAR